MSYIGATEQKQSLGCMWSHRAKAITWVYAIHFESAAAAAGGTMHTFTVNRIHPNDGFCLVAPQLYGIVCVHNFLIKQSTFVVVS